MIKNLKPLVKEILSAIAGLSIIGSHDETESANLSDFQAIFREGAGCTDTSSTWRNLVA